MTIVLLCPSRGRPLKCNRMIQSVCATSTGIIDIMVTVSPDEYATYAATLKNPAPDRVGIHLSDMPKGMPTAYKWNKLAEQAMNQKDISIFMLASDDTIFSTPCWDEALIKNYESLENKIHVYAFRDSRDISGTPHPIVTREYIEAMGYFLPPLFLHWFVDSWTVDIAKSVGCFTHMMDYLLIHDKPSDSGQPDETHTNIRKQGWHERDKWVNDRCQHFLEVEKINLMKYFSKSARAVG